MGKQTGLGILSIFFGLILSATALGQSTYDTVVLTNNNSLSLTSVYRAVSNNAGDKFFYGTLSGGDRVIVKADSTNTLSIVAQEGIAIPGYSETISSFLGQILTNDDGEIAFCANTQSNSDPAIFLWNDQGQLHVLAKQGDVDSTGNHEIAGWQVNDVQLDSQGRVYIKCTHSNADRAFWRLTTTQRTVLLDMSDQPPGLSNSVNYESFGWFDIHEGRLVYEAELTDYFDGNFINLHKGIFQDVNGTQTKLVSSNDTIANTQLTWMRFTNDNLAPNNQVAFSGGPAGNTGSVFRRDSSGDNAIVAMGDPAPTADPSTIMGFLDPRMNQNGKILLPCYLSGSNITSANNYLVMVADRNAQTLVAQKGQAVDGVSGAVFTNIYPYAINDQDQVLVSGRFRGQGLTNSNNEGLFATDSNGILRLIARLGDTIDVDPSANTDLRTIREFRIPGGLESTCLSNNGEVVFQLTFTDGTNGIFVTDVD